MPRCTQPLAVYALIEPKSHGQRRGIVKCDGRSPEGRLLKNARKVLLAHVGADATPIQKSLIERAAMLELRVAMLDKKVIDGSFTDYDGKTYNAVIKQPHPRLQGPRNRPSQARLRRPDEALPWPTARTAGGMTAVGGGVTADRARDPVAMMLDIADRFMCQARELDDRTTDAIDADASQGDIIALRNLADTSRLRALAACQAAAPYVSPRLQAVEFSPATPLTRSRFEERLGRMSEDEVLGHLKSIAAGTLTLEAIDLDEEAIDAVP